MDRNNFSYIPEELWARIVPHLPRVDDDGRTGRPRKPDKRIFGGIVYRLRTGCQWKAIPRQFASGSTCHRRFQEWTRAGVFQRVFADLVRFYDELVGIDWKWSALDTAMVKAPKGGTRPGRILPIGRSWASSATF